MNNAAKLGAGVAGGYLLGRTKKLKLAIGLGAWLMGKRLQISPTQLAMQGLGQLRESPEFGELTERMRTELGGAGKRALTAAATSRMDSLADRLGDRNRQLEEGGDEEDYDDDVEGEEDEYDEEEDEPRAEDEDYDDDVEGEEDEYDEEEDEEEDEPRAEDEQYEEDEDEDDADEISDEEDAYEDDSDEEPYPDEQPRRQRTSARRR